MKNLPTTILLVILLPWGCAHSTPQQGVVKIFGTSESQVITLVADSNDSAKNIPLCMNDVAKKIEKLAGMGLQVEGEWQTLPASTHKCFLPQDFRVEFASSGRQAFVGILMQKADKYVLQQEDGNQIEFQKLSSGVKQLIGKKVIIDAKPLPNTKGKDYQIVTYALYP